MQHICRAVCPHGRQSVRPSARLPLLAVRSVVRAAVCHPSVRPSACPSGRLCFRPPARPAVRPLAVRENVPRNTTQKSHMQIRCWARAQCTRHHMTQISFTRNAYTSSYSFRSLLGSGFAVLQIAVVVLTTAAALLAAMPSSALCRAKRAFVSVLLSVASMYGVSALVNRESEDKDVLRAYRQVIKKAHPDHVCASVRPLARPSVR